MLLYIIETTDKLVVCLVKSGIGIEVIQAAGVYYAEQEVSELGLRPLGVFTSQFGFQFFEFLAYFTPYIAFVFPIEAYVSCLVLNAVGFYQ